MKPFIKAREKKEEISHSKLDKFSDVFNKQIAKGKFTVNTGLHGIPELNEDELKTAQLQALKDGYKLTSYEDNCNTTTYKLEII